MFPVCKISRTSDVYDYCVIHPKSCWSLLSPSAPGCVGRNPTVLIYNNSTAQKEE